MAGEAQENPWPLPKFYFEVEWGGQNSPEMGFQEVTGIDVEAQVIEYRSGNSKDFSSVKMPGLKKNGNVTMKKGMFKGDNSLWEWFNEIKMNTINRETCTIKLLDEEGSPVVTWTLANAFPTKLTATDLKSDANEVAIETIEIAHEGITEILNS